MKVLFRGTRRDGRFGVWWPLKISESGRTSAMARCPTCGGVYSLDGHQIAADGLVAPSVQCAQDGCDFHDQVQLDGWEP